MSSPSKAVHTFETKVVQFYSPLDFDEVVKRMDEAVNKQGSANILARLKAAIPNQAETERIINEVTGDNDILFFTEFKFQPLLNMWHQASDAPKATNYIIGNPLIAQSILRNNVRAGAHVPPRLLIMEKPDRSGTEIIYQLPSSVMVFPEGDNGELRRILENLDKKVESLVRRVLAAKL